MTIYLDWLSLPKDQFKILMFLLDTKQSTFSIENILNYFLRGKSSKNIKKIKTALTLLAKEGGIDLSIDKGLISATILPQEKEYIEIEEGTIRISDFSSQHFSVSIDGATALKVLFAILCKGENYKACEIAELLRMNRKSVGRVISLLKKDFIDFDYRINKIFLEEEGLWQNESSHLGIGAFGLVREK